MLALTYGGHGGFAPVAGTLHVEFGLDVFFVCVVFYFVYMGVRHVCNHVCNLAEFEFLHETCRSLISIFSPPALSCHVFR